GRGGGGGQGGGGRLGLGRARSAAARRGPAAIRNERRGGRAGSEISKVHVSPQPAWRMRPARSSSANPRENVDTVSLRTPSRPRAAKKSPATRNPGGLDRRSGSHHRSAPLPPSREEVSADAGGAQRPALGGPHPAPIPLGVVVEAEQVEEAVDDVEEELGGRRVAALRRLAARRLGRGDHLPE